LTEISKRFKLGQFEAYGSRNNVTTIRMATNHIEEAKSLQTGGVSVRVVFDGSIGFASTNILTDAKLEGIVEKAYHMAKAKKPDPNFNSLPEPKRVVGLEGIYDPELNDIDLTVATSFGRDALSAAHEVDASLDLSGSVNIVASECWIQNSLGVNCSDVNTIIHASITAEKGEETSGMGQTCTNSLKKFKIEKAAREAADAAVEGAKDAKTVSPGKYDIIFGPYAASELIEFVLSYALDLSAVDVGISYLRDKLDEEVASQSFNLIDDGRSEVGVASKSVDDEGIPTQRTVLIEGGVLKRFLANSYYANKLTSSSRPLTSTGNGFRTGDLPGRIYSHLPHIQTTNLVVDAGDRPLQELVSNTKKGILLGRVWYTYPLNPTIGDFSTTNRGQTFYIEGGRIKYPVKPNSFRVSDNLPKLLKNIEGLGQEQIQSMVWGSMTTCLTPHIKFRDVNVTYSKT
jgi:PmbA protein